MGAMLAANSPGKVGADCRVTVARRIPSTNNPANNTRRNKALLTTYRLPDRVTIERDLPLGFSIN